MEPTYGDYNPASIDGIDTLIARMKTADTARDWSFILNDYISWGNNKIDSSVAIFNLNAATDCPNADTERCQVPWDACYAHKAENMYPQTLPYRRRQEFLWDSLDPDTWAEAFLSIVSRKRSPVTAVRFSEAGDFRNNGDIVRVNRIARLLQPHGIDVYTYSATSYLDWDLATDFTVNQSNDFRDYGDRLFTAVPTESDIPDGAVMCPFDYATKHGVTGDERPKCGECRLCIDDTGPDVYITLH
jgi:hypothetical protein